ncbi:MAG: glycoside hydrolase family 65 protein [Bacteriovoracia bacterium]
MTEWTLEFNDWTSSNEKLRETLCTLGNGYIATRGAREESSSRDDRYSGTYLGGGYDRAETVIKGKIIENEDLVNWPDWTCLDFRIDDGDWFSLHEVEILEFHQVLNMMEGVLKRRFVFKTENKETIVESERIVSMANPHVCAIKFCLKPVNWQGIVEVRSIIDGSVINHGVKRYRSLTSKHLKVEDAGLATEDAVFLNVKTLQSQVSMTMVSRTKGYEHQVPLPLERKNIFEEEKVGQGLRFKVRENRTATIEKVVTIYTSHDFAISNPLDAARKLNHELERFDDLLKAHMHAWKFLWDRFNITLRGMPQENSILRLHIFHLLQTVSHNSIGRDVSVPSRGLHGEAYRGHIFWDETFIFPFIYFRMPELAVSLLMYRYRRLDEARRLAKENGFGGAMYPWQSGSDGREESQVIHLNPVSGNWIPDNTYKQRHLNGAIVYNIIKYFEVTNDREFMSLHGAEMVLEIAQFWISAVSFNADKGRYEIKGIVGPDEFHTQYPDTDELGLNNNAYTNYLASWSIRKGLEALVPLASSRRDELMNAVGITCGDLVHWEHVSRNIFIPLQEDGIISQFEGFEKLKEFDWEGYGKKYADLQRLDRILEAEGDSVNNYKVNKQADVLMLFYLFTSEEIKEGFEWLGYSFDPGWIPKNIDYYLSHSSNGSSLSRIVHAWVLSRSDRRHSWKIFKEALLSDVADIQGGTTSEGIHLGAMAGTVDIVQRCFTGMEVDDGIIWFNPQLPDELGGVDLVLRFQNHWLTVSLDKDFLVIRVDRSWEPEGKIGFRGKVYTFQEGTVFNFNLKDDSLQKELS